MPEALIPSYLLQCNGLPWWRSGKESACNARVTGSIPGSEDPTEKEVANPLQYSYLGNPMDRGAWWAAVHGIAKEPDVT